MKLIIFLKWSRWDDMLYSVTCDFISGCGKTYDFANWGDLAQFSRKTETGVSISRCGSFD